MPPIPNTSYSRDERALAYFSKGKSCIEAAEWMFKEKPAFPVEIFLVQGIELLFSSFLLKLDPDSSILDGKSLHRLYGHKYSEIYKRCKEIDISLRIFTDPILENYINFLANNFFEDSIVARYPDSDRLDKMPEMIFAVPKVLIERLRKDVFK